MNDHSNNQPVTPSAHEHWNKGKTLGQKLPFKLKEIWGIRTRLELAGKRTLILLFRESGRDRTCPIAGISKKVWFRPLRGP